jgi:hypothetical protein
VDELARWNERYKGWAMFCENAALAFFVGSGVEIVRQDRDPRAVLIVVGIVAGFAFLWLGWYVRRHIYSEAF